MSPRSSLILCVSVTIALVFASCLGKRVSCNVPSGSEIELLDIKDTTKNPYLYDYLERNLFKKLSIQRETQGNYLLEIALKSLTTSCVAHDISGYQAHNRIFLTASFNIYRKGRVEPFISRTITLTDSYYVNPNPNIALSERKAAINRLSLKLINEIERSIRVYFCSHQETPETSEGSHGK